MNGRRRISGLKGSWEWLKFAAQLPANPILFNNVTGHLTVFSGRCIVTGMSAFNSSVSGSNVDLYDGTDGSGIPFDVLPFGSSAPFSRTYGGQGILLESGLHMYTGAATLAGSAWLIPLWHDDYTEPGD